VRTASDRPAARPSPGRHRLLDGLLTAGSITLAVLAVGTCLLLGTLGWFAVGFGTMTACTNAYDCTETGCAPCAGAEHWLGVGAFAQLTMATVGAVLAVLLAVARRRATLAIGALALIAVSVGTIVVTTRLANDSYCRPDTPDDAWSGCSAFD
jgi:hypothetical protein